MRSLLRSKIHNATVSEANLDYIGSITIDPDLIERVGLWVGEKVLVVSNTTGARIETYVIAGERGSGYIAMNGAAAHSIKAGEQIIIMGFELTTEPISPKIILVDEQNRFVRYLSSKIDFEHSPREHQQKKVHEMTFAGHLEQILLNKSPEEQFSGAILVRRDEQDLFKAAYGYANLPWKIQNRVDTRFRIASVSKMFTAVAILQLIEQGKLSPDTRRNVLAPGNDNSRKLPSEYVDDDLHRRLVRESEWGRTWAALCRGHPFIFSHNED
jgi:aspartate 1-decarboxylase